MRQVKIADLKAHLSAYLAAVRAGETIEVCDRNTPIARLEPSSDALEGLDIREPTAPRTNFEEFYVARLNVPVDVVALLRDSRDQR